MELKKELEAVTKERDSAGKAIQALDAELVRALKRADFAESELRMKSAKLIGKGEALAVAIRRYEKAEAALDDKEATRMSGEDMMPIEEDLPNKEEEP